MPVNAQVFQKLYTNPEFVKMDYNTQQAVRLKLLQKQLEGDQEFQGLEPNVQSLVIQKLANRYVNVSPAFEDPSFYNLLKVPRFINGVLDPAVSNSLIGKGVIGTATLIDRFSKMIGFTPKSASDIWQMEYSKDNVKLTQYVADQHYHNQQLPYTMAKIGDIADWIGLSGIASGVGGAVKGVGFVAGATGGVKGLGIAEDVAKWLAKATKGNITEGLGGAIGRFVTKGAKEGALFNMGMREYLFNTLGSQVARSAGMGASGVAKELQQHYLTPDIPWAPGIEATAKDITRTFGQFAAFDYLLNVGINSLVPFARVSARAITGKGLEIGGLRELERYTPEARDAYTRQLKLGTMDDAVWSGMPLSVKDHLTARAAFEVSEAGGAGVISHDPVMLAKNLGFLTNHDIVDSTEPGTFRIRTSPGSELKQIIAGQEVTVKGSTVLADGIRLPEVQRILAERYGEARSGILRGIEESEKKLEKAKVKLEEIPDGKDFLGEKMIQAQAVNSINSRLQGQIITRNAYASFDPYFLPVLESVESAKASFSVQMEEGAISGAKRTAITYGEAAAVDQVPGAKTVRFKVDLPSGQLSGKEARIRMEGSEPVQVRTIKDFFVKQSDPFLVKPSEGDFNALLTYSHPASQRIYDQTIAVINEVKGGVTKEELAQAKLLSAGFDAVKMKDGSVLSLLPRNQIKHVSDLIDVKTGKYKAGFDTGKPAATVRSTEGLSPSFISTLGKDVHIKQSFRIGVTDEALSGNEEALVSVMKHIYGDVRGDLVNKVARIALSRTGQDASNLLVRTKQGLDMMKMSLEKEGKKLVLTVPAEIKTVQEQYLFIQRMGDLIENNAKRRNRLPLQEGKETLQLLDTLETGLTGKEAVETASKNIFASPLPGASDVEKTKWLIGAADVTGSVKLKMTDVPTLLFPDGTSFSSNIVDDLIDEFLVHNTSEAQIRYELKDALGYELKRSGTEGNWYEVWDRKTKIAEAATLPDLLHRMNWRPEKIDSVFAPTFIEVGPVDTEFTLNGKYLISGEKAARQHLDRFWDPATATMKSPILKTPIGRISKYVDQTIEVEIPSWGIRRTFEGEEAVLQARQFLEGRYQSTAEIERLAAERGMVFRDRGGEYVIYDETGTYHAKSLDEVGKILAQSPDPSFLPNILPEVPEGELAAAKLSYDASFAPSYWALPADFARQDLGVTSISKFIRPRHDWLITYAKKSGHYKLVEIYGRMEIAIREAMRQVNEARRLILYHLSDQVGRKGKESSFHLFPDDKLRGLTAWMEETTPEGKVRVAEAFKLEEKHLEGARAIRDLLGTDPLTNPGLFGKFGINTNQFLFEYLPRLRAKMMEKGSKVLEGLGDDGLRFLLGESFGGAEHIPHSMSFFAEKERLSDMVEFARENNLAKLLLRYNEKGTKKFFLNSLWQELDDYKLHAPGGGIDTVAADSMQRYQEMVMGKYTDHAERAVKKFGRDFAVRWNAAQNKVRGKLGMEPIVLSPTAGEHLMDMLFTTNTLTTQSYRVWLTLRNMTQMYTTSGALMGNQWIEKATMELSKGTALEDYIEVLRKRGTITEAPPLLNEITKGESKIGGAVGSVTEVGMRPMKRSDDITRAISYRAAEMKWDHFFSRLQKIKGSDLEGTIGINFLHDEIGGMVKQEIAKGTPESLSFAKHLFADDMTRLTMFDYAKQNMAQIGHGWLGKLFGQYQVYPIYYASFLKHVATHGTLPQKVAILGRVALNATATAGALSLMGIDGKNMLPWVPAQMTGGPLFNLALQVMQASDTTSYRGRAARGELIGTLSHLIPGSYEYQMVSNALKYFEAGKPVLALWALTSAPIRQDLRVK